VDATQSGEVVFALAGSVLFLGAEGPGIGAVTGIVLILAGLSLFVRCRGQRS
jgi:hypothetical protein